MAKESDKTREAIEDDAADGDAAGDGSQTSKQRSESTSEGTKANPDPKTVETKKPSVWAKYRSEFRIAIIGAVITVLVTGAFAPTRDWAGGALDEVHDFFLGYPGQEWDSVKETIEDRPFWQEGPSFKDGAFSYAEKADQDGEVVSTLSFESTRPVVISVDELVNESPEYEGQPVILVGRFFEESPIDLEGDSGLFPVMSKELLLNGNERYAYVGTADSSYAWKGLVAYVGILMATGRAYNENYPEGVPVAYFFGVKGIEVNPNDPALRPSLKELAPDEFGPRARG